MKTSANFNLVNKRLISNFLGLILACSLLAFFTGHITSCSSNEENVLKNPEISLYPRSSALDTTYLSGTGFSVFSVNSTEVQITATGNSQWLDNNDGSTWTSYGSGYKYSVKCKCIGSETGCQHTQNMTSQVFWCNTNENCDNCEMIVTITTAQNVFVTQVNNGITIRSY